MNVCELPSLLYIGLVVNMRYKRAGTSLWRVNYKSKCNWASICCHFFCQLKHLLVYLASARNWFAVTEQVPEPVQVVRWWHSSAVGAGKGRRHRCSVSWHCCLSVLGAGRTSGAGLPEGAVLHSCCVKGVGLGISGPTVLTS